MSFVPVTPPLFLQHAGEAVVIHPPGRVPSTVYAVVDRFDAEPVPGAGNLASPSARVTFQSDDLKGLSVSSDLLTNCRVELPDRPGGASRVRQAGRVVEQDEHYVTLEVR
jgi:hypothetical protein